MILGSGHMHGGDAIWSLLILRKLRGPHTLYVSEEYIPALTPFATDASTTLLPATAMPPGTPDAWIASGRFEKSDNLFYRNDTDMINFLVRWGNAMAREASHHPFVFSRADFLFDFPCLLGLATVSPKVLVVNCTPKSGQWPNYDEDGLDRIIAGLASNHDVLCTNPTKAAPWAKLSLLEIGRVAKTAELIVGVPSAPWWPSVSIWNKQADRLAFLDPVVLNYGDSVKPIAHHGLCMGAEQHLKDGGWI